MIKNAKQTLEWTRSKVLELSSEGRSQSDIARILQVSPATINTATRFLKQEAKVVRSAKREGLRWERATRSWNEGAKGMLGEK